MVCAKLYSRFAEPRISLWEGFNFVYAKPPLRRAELRFEKPRKVPKGFNFVSGKLVFGWAASRFAEPRCSLQRERLVTFCVVQKVTKKHTGLRPATSIQSSVEEDFSRVFRRHVSKPVFRTKRRRKGFESVRDSGVTAQGFRADCKRMDVFFADSRLWLGANGRWRAEKGGFEW